MLKLKIAPNHIRVADDEYTSMEGEMEGDLGEAGYATFNQHTDVIGCQINEWLESSVAEATIDLTAYEDQLKKALETAVWINTPKDMAVTISKLERELALADRDLIETRNERNKLEKELAEEREKVRDAAIVISNQQKEVARADADLRTVRAELKEKQEHLSEILTAFTRRAK